MISNIGKGYSCADSLFLNSEYCHFSVGLDGVSAEMFLDKSEATVARDGRDGYSVQPASACLHEYVSM